MVVIVILRIEVNFQKKVGSTKDLIAEEWEELDLIQFYSPLVKFTGYLWEMIKKMVLGGLLEVN